jgi:hypothetical protein
MFPILIIYLFQKNKISIGNYLLLDGEKVSFFRNLFIIVTLTFSLYQKYLYTYRDSSNRFAMTYPINFEKLDGVYTTQKRARLVEELLLALQKRLSIKRQLFVSEKMSTLYYLLNQTPPLSHPWAVDHINHNKFKREFLDYTKKTLPIVARAKYSVSTFNWPYDKVRLNNAIDANKNRELLNNFMKQNNYKKIWENEYFEIWDRIDDK